MESREHASYCSSPRFALVRAICRKHSPDYYRNRRDFISTCSRLKERERERQEKWARARSLCLALADRRSDVRARTHGRVGREPRLMGGLG